MLLNNITKCSKPTNIIRLMRGFSTSVQHSQKKISQIIGFIGDGNMAKAICHSMKRASLIDYSQVYVSSPFVKNLDLWKEFGANTTIHNYEVAQKADIIFLAVKPHVLDESLTSLLEHKDTICNKLFISILAGIRLKDLEEKLKHFKGSRVIRVMPNTPMLVGEGCTVYCLGKDVTTEDVSTFKTMLEVTGHVEKIPEKLINGASALAGSGPAFVYLFIEALSDGGVRMGLHRETATRLAAQTVMGSATMLLKTDKHMGILKDEVCSAGGMNIAAVHALEKDKFRGSVMNAVEAAVVRAEELSEDAKEV